MPRPVSNIWDHFLILNPNGSKKHVTCIYCNSQYKHAMANKLRDHIVKCKKCPISVKNNILYERYKKMKKAKSSNNVAASSVRSPLSPPTHDTIPIHNHDNIDAALARAIYASGVPLSVLESDYWKQVFQLFDASYEIPTERSLNDSLLEAEYSRVKSTVDDKLNKAVGLTLICEGWTDMAGNDVINFLIATPEPILFSTLHLETQEGEGDYICSQINPIIKEIGPSKFTAVLMTNKPNIKAACRSINSSFPQVAIVTCLNYTLNLISRDVLNAVKLFKDVIVKTVEVIEYIQKSEMISALFKSFQTLRYGSVTSLILCSKSKLNEAHTALKSYRINKEALELMALSNEAGIKLRIQEIILDSEMWQKIDEVIKILRPLSKSVILCEQDNLWLSDALIIFRNLIRDTEKEFETTEFLTSKDKKAILSTFQTKENSCLGPIHYAAYLLDPRYCGEGLDDEEVSMSFEYLRTFCTDNGAEEARVLKNIVEFKMKNNFFHESKAIWCPAKELQPRMWWKTFAPHQDAADIASKILSVPSSLFTCNRILKEHAHIYEKDCIDNSRNMKLMFIRSNLALLQFENSKESTINLEHSTEDEQNEDSEWETEVLDLSDPLL